MAEPFFLPDFFDSFPNPALLVRDGVILYRNAAAGRLPGPLQVGGPVPSFLKELFTPGIPSSGACADGERCWSLTAAPGPGGDLLLFFPEPAPAGAASPEALAVLLEQMRQDVGNLMAAAHLISPALRERGEPKYDQYLAIMNQSFYRLMRLMNGAESARALADGTLPHHPAPLDLAGLVRELGNEAVPLAALAGVELHWDSGPASLLTTGDAALLRRMLLALLSNALAAAGRGGQAGLRLTRSGSRAVVTVWDSGSGLSGSAAIRTPYHAVGGLGVGLNLAHQCAALHGGAVMVDSAQGKGARAVVSLPIQPPGMGGVRTPPPPGDPDGGFSPVLVEFSHLLPWEAFLPDDLE